MDNLLPTNEYTEVEGRVYSNPQVGLDETNTFIDNLRATQGQQNQEITQQTQRLGTDVPTILGGLTGADSYFTSRYQIPQTNANVANLRATAQAAALNEVLANEQAIWKNRYQNAYRNYQKRQYDRSRYGSGGGGSNKSSTDDQLPISGNVVEEDTTGTVTSVVPGAPGGYTVANIVPDWENLTSTVTGYTYVPYGQEGKTNYIYGGGPGKNINSSSNKKLGTGGVLDTTGVLGTTGLLGTSGKF